MTKKKSKQSSPTPTITDTPQKKTPYESDEEEFHALVLLQLTGNNSPTDSASPDKQTSTSTASTTPTPPLITPNHTPTNSPKKSPAMKKAIPLPIIEESSKPKRMVTNTNSSVNTPSREQSEYPSESRQRPGSSEKEALEIDCEDNDNESSFSVNNIINVNSNNNNNNNNNNNKRPIFPNETFSHLRTGLSMIINLGNNLNGFGNATNININSVSNNNNNNNNNNHHNTHNPSAFWSGSYSNNHNNVKSGNNANNNDNNNNNNNSSINWDIRSGNSNGLHYYQEGTVPQQKRASSTVEETTTTGGVLEITNANRDGKNLLGSHRFITQFLESKIDPPQHPIEAISPPSDELDHEDSQSEKPKRHRTSPEQLSLLEYVFHTEQMPSQALRQQIAERLGMTSRRVQIWFQNKRAKVKRREAVPVPTLFEDPKSLPLPLYQTQTQTQNQNQLQQQNQPLQHPPSLPSHSHSHPHPHPHPHPHVRDNQLSVVHDYDPYLYSHPHAYSRNQFDHSKVPSSSLMNTDRRDVMSLSSLTQQNSESQPPYSRHTSPTRVSILGMKRKEPENLQTIPIPFTSSLTLPRIDAPDLKKRSPFGQIPQPPRPLSLSGDRNNRPTLPPLIPSQNDETSTNMFSFSAHSPSSFSLSLPHPPQENKRPAAFTPLLLTPQHTSFSKNPLPLPSSSSSLSPISPRSIPSLTTTNSSPSILHSHPHPHSHQQPFPTKLHYSTQQPIHHSWSYKV